MIPNNPKYDINMAQYSTQSDYFADIMPMEGLGGKTFSVSTTKVADSTAFFAAKRGDTKEQVVGVGSHMVFETVGARSRGVRPWELARYEANQRRAKDQEFHRQRKAAIVASTAHKKYSVPKPPVTVSRVEPLHIAPPYGSLQNKAPSNPVKEVVAPVVDAWDD
jgi:hypothetical protein